MIDFPLLLQDIQTITMTSCSIRNLKHEFIAMRAIHCITRVHRSQLHVAVPSLHRMWYCISKMPNWHLDKFQIKLIENAYTLIP